MRHPRWVMGASIGLVVVAIGLSVLPSIWPDRFSALHSVKVDTDPENMLASDNPNRAFHRDSKVEFELYDQIALGVVHDSNPEGVFNPETLANVWELTQYIQKIEGVVAPKLISPSTIDDIQQAGLGAVSFNWLMPQSPTSSEEALQVRDRLLNLPLMRGSVVDEAGKSLLLYIPIVSKDQSYRVSTLILERIESLPKSGEQYHITGLPVANDTFGVQMFVQMAISAPMAMALIFLLMWFFFKRVSLILSPMIVAMVSVILTMGTLIITGNTIHIMSSMIPIFIMPIAVLDAVHILSEFYDLYPKYKDRKATMQAVMDSLWQPMLFTTLTTTAGFASLALAPIPPVQVFGIFVALGVVLAWLFTIVLIPAYIALLPKSALEGYGYQGSAESHSNESHAAPQSGFAALTRRFRLPIIGASLAIAAISAFGISKIVINDNPIKWFEPSHRIRVADATLNERFSGTYPAYLVIDGKTEGAFKDPENLALLESLQRHLETLSNVGKTASINELVKTVYRELLGGDEENFRIPNSSRAVAQTVLTYESSHRPDDLWSFVTPDFRKANIFLQLNSGDNVEMNAVARSAEKFLSENEMDQQFDSTWFGLTYINVIWQDEMVSGMLSALLSSFVIVFILMTLLFRSPLWGLLSMIPLSLTIALIYGIIGLVGKDYDMPVAVLSSLSLGLAIDYAIHFLARSRDLHKVHGNWNDTLNAMFDEPARAITRNIIVIGVGFLPLLLAPLVPYQTVGLLISSILVTAGATTLILLPALMTLFQKRLFPVKRFSIRRNEPLH